MHIRAKEVKISQVEFLTPARVTATFDGEERTFMVSVDIINRKVYDADYDTWLSEYIFDHLDDINSIPEDFFAAPDELHAKATEFQDQQEKLTGELIGDNDE